MSRSSVVAIFIVALSSCGLNNGSLNANQRGSSSTTSTLPTNDSSTSTDGAKGICTYYPTGQLDRTYCIACYEDVLDLYCTGAETQEGCADPLVRNSFDNYLNICISNRISSGFSCSNTCTSGFVLNNVTCVCEPAPIPPLVNPGVNAPLLVMNTDRNFSGEYHADPIAGADPVPDARCNPGDCCTSQTLRFNAINQADTSPTGNAYTVLGTGCNTPAGTGIYTVGLSASTPTLRPITGLTSQVIWNLHSDVGGTIYPDNTASSAFFPAGTSARPVCWIKMTVKDSLNRSSYYCYSMTVSAVDNGHPYCSVTAVPYSPSSYSGTSGWYQIPSDTTACIP